MAADFDYYVDTLRSAQCCYADKLHAAVQKQWKGEACDLSELLCGVAAVQTVEFALSNLGLYESYFDLTGFVPNGNYAIVLTDTSSPTRTVYASAAPANYTTLNDIIQGTVNAINAFDYFTAYQSGNLIYLQSAVPASIGISLTLTFVIPEVIATTDPTLGVGVFPEMEQSQNPNWASNPFGLGWSINNDTSPSCIDWTVISGNGYIRVNVADYLAFPPAGGYVSFTKTFNFPTGVYANRFWANFNIECEAGVGNTVKYFVGGVEQLYTSSDYNTASQLPIYPQSVSSSVVIEFRIHVDPAATDPYITISNVGVLPLAMSWNYSSNFRPDTVGDQLVKLFAGSSSPVLYTGTALITGQEYLGTIILKNVTAGSVTVTNGSNSFPFTTNGTHTFLMTMQAAPINLVPSIDFLGGIQNAYFVIEGSSEEFSFDLNNVDLSGNITCITEEDLNKLNAKIQKCENCGGTEGTFGDGDTAYVLQGGSSGSYIDANGQPISS